MYSVIIKGGRILDGSGNPWFRGDIGIQGDTITYIGDLSKARADKVIDAKDMVVSPGFIDFHTHSDIPLLVDGYANSHIRQGVTTNVIGHCGSSLAPLNEYMKQAMDSRIKDASLVKDIHSMSDYMSRLEAKGVSINVVPLVGQSSIRRYVMDFDDSAPSSEQLAQMKELIRQAMEEGSYGFSTGLIYTPSCYASTEELIELAKVVAAYDGVYSTHIRGENDTVLAAVREAIEIGKAANISVQISHLKAMGSHMWGASVDILGLIDKAREEGVDVTFDQYPYNASATGLGAALPPWAHVGGREKMMERLSDDATRQKMRQDILEGVDDWVSIHKGVGWDKILITSCPDTSLEGRTVAEIAEERGLDGFDTCFNLLTENKGNIGIVYFTIGDEDLERIMQHPAMMVGSDSSAIATEGVLAQGKPHPRSFGTFTRVLGRYVRDKGTISLAEAIRKMTFAPAQKLRLHDRGLLRPGMKADIVIFNPNTVTDKGDYADPFHYSEGVEAVLVNGRLTVEKDQHLGVLAGAVLRKNRK